MENVKTPEGYPQLSPYLIVKNAAGFMDFLKTVFDAEEVSRHMRDETTIMHGEMRIGREVIMLADSTDEFSAQGAGLFIYVDDADKRYDTAMKAGGTSVMPPNDQPYGRTSGVRDGYGNTWWITSVK